MPCGIFGTSISQRPGLGASFFRSLVQSVGELKDRFRKIATFRRVVNGSSFCVCAAAGAFGERRKAPFLRLEEQSCGKEAHKAEKDQSKLEVLPSILGLWEHGVVHKY